MSCPTRTLRPAGKSARPSPHLEAHACRNATDRRDRTRPRWHLRRTRPGTSPASPIRSRIGCAAPPRRRRLLAAGRTGGIGGIDAILHLLADSRLSPARARVRQPLELDQADSPAVHPGHGRARDLSPGSDGSWTRAVRVRIEDGIGEVPPGSPDDTGEPVEIGREREDVEETRSATPSTRATSWRTTAPTWPLVHAVRTPAIATRSGTQDGVAGAFKQTERLWRLICEIARRWTDRRLRISARRRAAFARLRTVRPRMRSSACDLMSVSRRSMSSRPRRCARRDRSDAGRRRSSLRLRRGGRYLVHSFAPMMPHLAEECWEALGHTTLVSQSWTGCPSSRRRRAMSCRSTARSGAN